jgi:hypothetical protein
MPTREEDDQFIQQFQVTIGQQDESKKSGLDKAYRDATGEEIPVDVTETEEEQLANLRLDERAIVDELKKNRKDLEDGLRFQKDKKEIARKLAELKDQCQAKEKEEEIHIKNKRTIELAIAAYQKEISDLNPSIAKKTIDQINFGIAILQQQARDIINAFKERLNAEIGGSWWRGNFIKKLEEMQRNEKVKGKENENSVGKQWEYIIKHVTEEKTSRGATVFHDSDRAPMEAIRDKIRNLIKIRKIKENIEEEKIKLKNELLLLKKTQEDIKETNLQINHQEHLLKLIASIPELEQKKTHLEEELAHVQSEITSLQTEVEKKQVEAFKVIYKALYEGQSKWFKKAPLLEKFKELTVEEIKQHIANKDKNERSCFAWELAQQEIHYKKCDLNNAALVTAIYKWAKKHTPIARSRDSFSYLFETETKGGLLGKFFPCFFKPQKETNDSKEMPQEIIDTGKTKKGSRLAKIADVFDKARVAADLSPFR